MEGLDTDRVPQPRQFVEHFVMNYVGPGLSEAYASQRASPSERLSHADKRFEEALRQYRLLLDHPISHTANLMSNCSRWDELAALVEFTEREYLRTTGPVRKGARWVSEHVPALQLWAGLLPTDNGLSVLTGGIKVLLGVAEKRSLQRKRMLASLRSMQDVVTRSEVYLKSFSENTSLQSAAVSLYVALLRMVEACINSLVHKSIWDKVQRGILRVDRMKLTVVEYTEQEIDQICEACTENRSEFDWQVEQIFKAKMMDAASGVDEIAAGITKLQPTLVQAASVSTETLQATHEVRERGRQAEKEIKIVRANVENHGDILDSHSDILVNIKGMLQDLVANSQWFRDAEDAKSQAALSRVQNFVDSVPTVTPVEQLPDDEKRSRLWQTLKVERDGYVDDAQSMTRGIYIQGEAPAYVHQMLKLNRFRQFIEFATSDAVFVELALPGQENDRYNPLTLGSAMLLQDVMKTANTATIHYFCGKHNIPQHPLHGGRGVAKMLLAQLLAFPQSYDLSFMDAKWWESLKSRPRDVLFETLAQLILQVRAATLFIVIDGASLFEVPDYLDDIAALMDKLLRVTLDYQHACHVKLMVTSFRSSRRLGPMFEEQGLRGLVRLQTDNRNSVSFQGLRVEMARYGANHSPSPGRRPSERMYYNEA